MSTTSNSTPPSDRLRAAIVLATPATIANLLTENRTFTPSAAFKAQANLRLDDNANGANDPTDDTDDTDDTDGTPPTHGDPWARRRPPIRSHFGRNKPAG